MSKKIIHHVCIQTNSYEESLDFYTRILGFEIVQETKNFHNRDYILDILNTDGSAFTRPWFGQLMTGPQLMAYLCQVNMWLERYQPKIKL